MSADKLLAAARVMEPNILIFDIETTPAKSWHWRHYQENISPIQCIEETTLLCYAAKWLGNPMIDFTRKKAKSDKAVCQELWNLLDRCDLAVAHNLRKFDAKVFNARCIKHGMPPPSPYKTVDTLQVAKAVGKFGINKLDYLSRYLGSQGKMEHEGFALWLKCMKNDPDAWERMEKYNIQDILELETLYLALRPWHKQHPNVGIMCTDVGAPRCIVCGSVNLKDEPQASYTAAGVYPTVRCRDCGKPMRTRKRDSRGDYAVANVM